LNGAACTFSGLFQGSSWVVDQAYGLRPFEDTHELRRAFQEALFAGKDTDKDALIASYPDLGSSRVAEGEEGPHSLRDQSALGLTHLAENEQTDLTALTTAYRERFGFPLIACVRDEDSFEQVMRHGWHRLENSPTQEHAAALIEIAKIAGHRFDDLVAGANPIHSARSRRMGVE
jgi:OHCU decarboxylase